MERRLLPVKEGSLRARVLEVLREAIFSGKFQPGDALREMHLAQDLQVSQTTVREALLQLEHMGLVMRVENKETVVTKLSSQEVRERLMIRVNLEGLACVEAARRMTKGNFGELNLRLKDYSRAISNNAYYEASQADLQFHRYIWQQSGNKTLYRMLDQISAPLFAFISFLHSSRLSDLKSLTHRHEQIVSALRKGDPEIILETIWVHIATFHDKFLVDNKFLNSGLKDFQALARALR